MSYCKIDKGFSPIAVFNEKFLEQAAKNPAPFEVALERDGGHIFNYKTIVSNDPNLLDDNLLYCDRLIKSLLWLVGGFKLYIKSPFYLYNKISKDYSVGGDRDFDVRMMQRVYDNKFEVVFCPENIPEERPQFLKCSVKAEGARIGFDAGGSDRKVSAVLDGEVLYSEEVVWYPKLNADPEYHYQGIKSAFEKAACFLPRVDAIGVSSAGIYVANQIKLASLFIKVSDDDFEKRVKNMYIDLAKEFNAPIVVANDGDVTALAGAIELGEANILGIAMGTSEAAGYIDGESNLLGWLNELAFVPVDVNKKSMIDEWSGDYGTGVKYMSQDGAIKLAEMAGIKLDEALSPAEKLKIIQKMANDGDEIALSIYEDIGVYLGYSTLYYHGFYGFKHLLLMGRVVSGKGGETILTNAQRILDEHLGDVKIILPDEKSRRVGQSVAASYL